MGGLKIIGYIIEGSTDHLIVDFNTNTVYRKNDAGDHIWEETFPNSRQLRDWIEGHRKAGLIYG